MAWFNAHSLQHFSHPTLRPNLKLGNPLLELATAIPVIFATLANYF